MKERQMINNLFDDFEPRSNKLMRCFKHIKLIQQIIKHKLYKFDLLILVDLLNTLLNSFEEREFLLLLHTLRIELLYIFQLAITQSIIINTLAGDEIWVC